jgi:hypothetical protein
MMIALDRSIATWPHEELVLRISIGLEAEQEVQADLEQVVMQLNEVSEV